jgi:hypothetical protein
MRTDPLPPSKTLPASVPVILTDAQRIEKRNADEARVSLQNVLIDYVIVNKLSRTVSYFIEGIMAAFRYAQCDIGRMCVILDMAEPALRLKGGRRSDVLIHLADTVPNAGDDGAVAVFFGMRLHRSANDTLMTASLYAYPNLYVEPDWDKLAELVGRLPMSQIRDMAVGNLIGIDAMLNFARSGVDSELARSMMSGDAR